MSKKKKSKKAPREKRNSNWFNDEGYFDPTVGQTLRNIARQEAQKRHQQRYPPTDNLISEHTVPPFLRHL